MPIKVYLQHDNEKPIKVPVKEPDKLPKEKVIIKGKEYRILSLDFEPIIEVFWGKKVVKNIPKHEGNFKSHSLDKLKKNLQILKETGKYPKD